MTHHEHLKILAFVGLPGSGKTTAVDYLTDKKYPKVYFGGVVLDALDKLGLEHTEVNEKKIREELRATEGNDFIVKRIIDQIHHLADAGQRHIVAESLYSWTEYKALVHAFPGQLTVVAVVAPKELRHSRLTHRPVRPLTEQEAAGRDWAQIENLEAGGPIAVADYFVMNDGNVERFYKQIDDIVTVTRF